MQKTVTPLIYVLCLVFSLAATAGARNPYLVLGFNLTEVRRIPPSEDQLRAAFVALAKKYHPDANPSNKELSNAWMVELNTAYDFLKDRSLRARFDRGEIDADGNLTPGGFTGFTRSSAQEESLEIPNIHEISAQDAIDFNVHYQRHLAAWTSWAASALAPRLSQCLLRESQIQDGISTGAFGCAAAAGIGMAIPGFLILLLPLSIPVIQQIVAKSKQRRMTIESVGEQLQIALPETPLLSESEALKHDLIAGDLLLRGALSSTQGQLLGARENLAVQLQIVEDAASLRGVLIRYLQNQTLVPELQGIQLYHQAVLTPEVIAALEDDMAIHPARWIASARDIADRNGVLAPSARQFMNRSTWSHALEVRAQNLAYTLTRAARALPSVMASWCARALTSR